MQVPFLDLETVHKELSDEILAKWKELLNKASFIGGAAVESFEANFAKACDVSHCVSLGSGTDALRFLYIGLGTKPGDEIITVPNTFIATTETITQAGGVPVFVDVDPRTYTIDPAKIEAAITKKTVGIVPVHLYGQCAEMTAINKIAEKHGLWVVEDAAQSHLAKFEGKIAGSMAHAGAFSFYPGKNLGACGEAGAIITNDAQLAAKVKMLRDHGQSRKYYHDVEGYNGRCDAIQAAALDIKLKHLPKWNSQRQANAKKYYDRLEHLSTTVTLPFNSPKGEHVYHLYVVQVNHRDELADKLRSKGIHTGLHYPRPLHLQKAYEHLARPSEGFPVAESVSANLLSLPMFPSMSDEQNEYVCSAISEFIST